MSMVSAKLCALMGAWEATSDKWQKIFVEQEGCCEMDKVNSWAAGGVWQNNWDKKWKEGP